MHQLYKWIATDPVRRLRSIRCLLVALALTASGLATDVSAAPAGAFVGYNYTNSNGTLSYKVYTPAGKTNGSLVVVLPGAGETSDAAATRSRFNSVADSLHFVVAYPEQNPAYNSSMEWDWEQSAQQGRTGLEPSLIAGITQTVTARSHIDPHRVYVMGISAGAGMASVMAVLFPDIYKGLGIEAGCAYDYVGCGGASVTSDQTAAAAVAAMGVYKRSMPVFNEYGDIDPIAAGVASYEVVPSWLTIDDTTDDGVNNGSVSRSPASQQTVLPPLPDKPYTVDVYRDKRGCELAENWVVVGESHAWSGGAPDGSMPVDPSSDPLAPDASTAMYKFFTSVSTLGGSPRCAVT